MRHRRLRGRLGRKQDGPDCLEGGRHRIERRPVLCAEGCSVGRIQGHERTIHPRSKFAQAFSYLCSGAKSGGAVQRYG
jgi:hypothetical protein